MTTEMPIDVAQAVFDYRNAVYTFLLTCMGGLAGSYSAVLLNDLDPTRPPMPPRQIWATIFIGTTMSVGFSSIIGDLVGVPFVKTLPIVATAILTGLLGKPIAKRLEKLSVYLAGKEGA